MKPTPPLNHEAFDIKTPNKVRALIGAFANQNLSGFHRADGAGYDFAAEQMLAIDKLNPQLAARLTTALESWRKLEPVRRLSAGRAQENRRAVRPFREPVRNGDEAAG
ncbi:MAG: aminopeptidase N C-terminal domain-containing protein [Parvularculaceae bacterium]